MGTLDEPPPYSQDRAWALKLEIAPDASIHAGWNGDFSAFENTIQLDAAFAREIGLRNNDAVN
jgi:hypothetical protein